MVHCEDDGETGGWGARDSGRVLESMVPGFGLRAGTSDLCAYMFCTRPSAPCASSCLMASSSRRRACEVVEHSVPVEGGLELCVTVQRVEKSNHTKANQTA